MNSVFKAWGLKLFSFLRYIMCSPEAVKGLVFVCFSLSLVVQNILSSNPDLSLTVSKRGTFLQYNYRRAVLLRGIFFPWLFRCL